MFRKRLFLSGLTGLVIVLASCGSPSPKLELIQPGSSMPQQGAGHLVLHDLKQEPFTVAENRRSVQAYKLITFNLAEVPKAARLDIVMTVVTYACAIKPGLPQGQTDVRINEQPAAHWSFNYDDQGKSYRTTVEVDPKLLRVGENKLEVVGSRCQLGNFEVVRFNSITLAK